MNIKRMTEYSKNYLPKEMEELIPRAYRVLNNTFLFDKEWDMERTYEPETFLSNVIWQYIPKDDPEWMYMMARNGFIPILAQAYAVSGVEDYRRKLMELVRDFIRSVPLTEQSRSTTWRTIDASLRAENWIQALEILKAMHALDASFEAEVLDSLREHGTYLYEQHDVFRTLSNWGIIGNMGLFAIGALLKNDTFTKAALERMETGLSAQVFVRDPGDANLCARVHGLLRHMCPLFCLPAIFARTFNGRPRPRRRVGAAAAEEVCIFAAISLFLPT